MARFLQLAGTVDRRVALVVFALACDPSITVSSGSALQVSWDAVPYTHLPALLVVAIDDGNDADAAAARALITHDALVASFKTLLLKFDPGSGFAEDTQVVVVHPRSGTFVTAIDDPKLRFSASATPFDLDVAADAVLAHTQEAIVADVAYPLIGRTRDVVSLFLHERSPRDAREAAMVASTPKSFRTVTVSMVTSRDDESRGPPELPPKAENAVVDYDVTVAPCAAKTPILEAWAKALMHEHVFAFVNVRSCGDVTPVRVFGETVDYACGLALSAMDIARDDTGAAECAITFDSMDVTSCNPARGWADPIGRDGLRRPWLDVSDGSAVRRCEIVQLSGAARASCEQSLACEGCSPGFCTTSLLDDGSACPKVARFVGSSLFYGTPPHVTKLHYTCNLR